jgi:hypothetical protein
MSQDTTRDTTPGRHTRILGHIGDDRGFDICLQPSVKVPPFPEDLLVYFFLSGYEQGLNWY